MALGASGAFAVVTTAAEGDARPGPGSAAGRCWTFARQVHGATVLVVDGPPGLIDAPADALVSASPTACLAVLGADCALVGLASPEGIVAVAHAGWRGLLAGVLGATLAEMRALGAGAIEAVLGPCIHAGCYVFGAAELELARRGLGPGVVARTRAGEPALDLPEGVRIALGREGVGLAGVLGGCTACGTDWFSHRARGDTGRQALAVSRSADRLGAR